MKSILFLTLILQFTFKIDAHNERPHEQYDSTEFINEGLEEFKNKDDNEYKELYKPLLKLVEDTLPFLTDIPSTLTGRLKYIESYFDNHFKSDYDYIQDRLEDAIIWIEKRIKTVEGKPDEEKLNKITKDLREAADLFKELREDLEAKFGELLFYEKFEKYGQNNFDRNELNPVDQSEWEGVLEDEEEMDVEKLKEIEKDIINIVSKDEYIEKAKAAVEKLKALVN